MTRMSIRELVKSWRPRYLWANRKEKGRILEEFVALTGYHRKRQSSFFVTGTALST